MLTALQVRNLRSLADTGAVRIAPLTLLVGRNSSGKSSFLRLFPLLRQSIEARTTGPILWYGSYVDFGSFEKTLRDNSGSDSIELGFTIPLSAIQQPRFGRTYYRYHRMTVLEDTEIAATLSLRQSTSGERTYLSRLELTADTDKILLALDEKSELTTLRINNRNLLARNKGSISITNLSLLPIPADESSTVRILSRSRQGPFIIVAGIHFDEVIDAMKPLFHHRSQQSTIADVAGRIGFGTQNAMLQQLKNLSPSLTGKIFQKNVAQLSIESEIFKSIRSATLAHLLPVILAHLDEELAEMSRGVRYIAPVRATAERYYRAQDLAVDEIDYRGTNLVMFLRSLSPSEQADFASWSAKNLGFSVAAKGEGGHFWLELEEGGGQDWHNLADMGFGFSQVLPIAAQLWSLVVRRQSTERETGRIFAIEQPELHLHPSHQARLADLFASSLNQAQKKNHDLRLIIETHSPSIINRIGSLIASGVLAPTDVNIVIFEKPPGDATSVSSATFNNKGALLDWPFGFFEPDEA